MAGDSYRALTAVVDDILAHESDEKALVMCGDNLDQINPEPCDIAVLTEQLNRLVEKGIPVYVIEGNHDTVYDKPTPEWEGKTRWAEVLSCMNYVDGEVVDILGLKHYFMSYVYSNKVYETLEETPECDVLIMHQPMDYLSPFEAFGIEPSDIPTTVKRMVVTGHVHVADMREAEDLLIVSPGCTHTQRFSHDPGTYFVYDPEAEEGYHVMIKNQRKFLRFNLCTCDKTTSEIVEDIKNTTSNVNLKAAVQIKFDQEHVQMLDDIKQLLADSVHIFPNRISDTNAVVVLASSNENTDYLELIKACGKLLSIELDETTEEIVLATAYNKSEGETVEKIDKLVAELEVE
jgi:DNA repair exonuclease SbcCD nuclease subunit